MFFCQSICVPPMLNHVDRSSIKQTVRCWNQHRTSVSVYSIGFFHFGRERSSTRRFWKKSCRLWFGHNRNPGLVFKHGHTRFYIFRDNIALCILDLDLCDLLQCGFDGDVLFLCLLVLGLIGLFFAFGFFSTFGLFVEGLEKFDEYYEKRCFRSWHITLSTRWCHF